jgi:hypothetical protein
MALSTLSHRDLEPLRAQQPQMGPGCSMTQDGVRSAGEHSRHSAPIRAEERVAGGVNTAMNDM